MQEQAEQLKSRTLESEQEHRAVEHRRRPAAASPPVRHKYKFQDSANMEAPEPGRNGSVKNLHRRSKSEGISLSSDLPPEQRQFSQVLPPPYRRKLFQELNVDDTQGSSVKKRKLYLELNVAAQGYGISEKGL
ncbi:unnamed protein product [Cuscuta campestris]|uniref:Uncharacterized protein n=1 Tax=Cuscuta campestris TaxID=132261 RepID=A0A484NF64_9ASTE|nr:unnamed protein product [Cuscuta campestris]